MKAKRIPYIAAVFCIIFSFKALAVTEYPWTGSERDAQRAGGLGWITVTQEMVLPGTRECNVMIFQSGDERWGYMAGEEDPDEFRWELTLYEKDSYTARVQLPYSTYTTYYLGVSAIPEGYRNNIPEGDYVYWFPANNLMIEESQHEYPERVETSCRLSEENPEGILSNDLIMLYSDAEKTSYDKDISFLFSVNMINETDNSVIEEKETVESTAESVKKTYMSHFEETLPVAASPQKSTWQLYLIIVLTALLFIIIILVKRHRKP